MAKFAKDPSRVVAVCFALAFGIWISCFWGFLTSRLALVSDATSYYDHVKFYVESMARGVFPLWDYFFNNYGGNSNDFFLKRIGAYNPLYLAMVLLVKAGCPYRFVYLWSMAGYYFLGVAGFYLLAVRLYKHRPAAFAGAMVLLFSALGTRIFDSYMVLVDTPLLWFFYFLVVFAADWSVWAFLGLTLTAAVLLTTYIPLYFITFLFVFVLAFVLLYHRQVPLLAAGFVRFTRAHAVAVLLCAAFLVLAVAPSLMFLKHASEGNLALPGRHYQATVVSNPLEVAYKIAASWGILEDVFYSGYFANLKHIKFAVVYIPIFAFIVLGMGLFNRLTRRTVFLFACAFLLLCLTVPYLLPLHAVLYKYFFYFKYFRNLHFFLWFMLIPLFILFVIDHLCAVLESMRGGTFPLWRVHCGHALALLFVLVMAHDRAWPTYAAIAASYVFFIAYARGRPFSFAGLVLALGLCVLIQPVGVYRYFDRNAEAYTKPYEYDLYPSQFVFKTGTAGQTKGGLYVAPFWYNVLYEGMEDDAFFYYTNWRLAAYDRVKPVQRWIGLSGLSRSWLKDENTAFVFAGHDPTPAAGASGAFAKPLKFEGDSPQLRVLRFNANEFLLRTDFASEKFLVYNDSYDPLWRVMVNGLAAPLYRANIAFKGVWVPAGPATVHFIYGEPWQHVLNPALVAAFALLLAAIILLRLREKGAA